MMTSSDTKTGLTSVIPDQPTGVFFGLRYDRGVPMREDGTPVPEDPGQWTADERYVLENYHLRTTSVRLDYVRGAKPRWAASKAFDPDPADKIGSVATDGDFANLVELDNLTALGSAAEFTNTLSSAWQLIKDGKPSFNKATDRCNALPKDLQVDWTEYDDTAPEPASTTWNFCHINGFGARAVDLTFEVKWNYDTRYAGIGKYIPNCWVELPTVTVLWGWNANVSITVQDPINIGKHDDPVAEIPLTISGSASSILKTLGVDKGFNVRADGTYC